MKMELLSSNNSYCDDDSKNLELLLDAFSSVVSLEDIASAYCQAGRDVYAAGELLCNHKGSISSSSGSKEDPDGASSSKVPTDNLLEKSYVERNPIAPKQRNRPVSMGTVSGVIGREYSWTKPPSYEQRTVKKPMKLHSSELPPSEVWGEHPLDSVATNETMKRDVEEFMFKMLGDGFKLDMGVIREVLGLCGYDVNKSMEKLLDLSASKLDETADCSSMRAQNKSFEAEGFPSNKVLQPRGSARSSETGMFTGVETDSSKIEKDTYDLQKDIMNSLFSVHGRIEETPKRIIRPVTRDRRGRFGRLVLEPPEDIPIKPRTSAKPKVTKDADESYDALRKAHKEYFTTMREYYKSATDAFVKGDCELSEKLMEQGNFFKKKAQEADDKSTEKLLETSDEDDEVFLLDLHDHEPREALRSLKCHLTSLSGIGAIPHLKVFVRSNENDTKIEAHKKKSIIELLENDSIEWTEEDNGQMIVIRVDKINPKRLSFAKTT